MKKFKMSIYGIRRLRNYAEIIDTFHFLKHASILYF